jgi:hypothetical protein
MKKEQFEFGLRAFCQRRPFRAFLIEFFSGRQQLLGHPEAIRTEAPDSFVLRRPDGGYVVFTAESVNCLLDLPDAQQA